LAPGDTPVEIIDRLNGEINVGLASSDIGTKFADLGTIFAITPAEFGKLIAGEVEKWSKVIRFADIKPQ
jgi:tripartite-type tricarboxylate transporter receptor subunit TctC